MATDNVLFWPKSNTRSKNFTVGENPVRIIGNINPGDMVCVWRVYDGTSDECKTDKIPDIPVMCCDLCGQLSLWKTEYADCESGYLTQSELLIETSGVFYLQYCCAEPEVNIPRNPPWVCPETPEGVYVWYREELNENSAC